MRNGYVATLTRNRWAVDHPKAASSAASAGPSTRLPFIITELRLTAPARSARSTSSGTLDCRAGAFSALAVPISSEATNSVQIGCSLATRIARPTLSTIWLACIVTRNGTRGTLSASTPAGIDSSRSGPSWVNTSRPTRLAEPVRCSMCAGSVKFCIHVPTLEANSPSQTSRNPRYDSAARADPGRWG